MTKVTQEIDNFIKNNGGCTRDALNVALFTIKKLRIEIEELEQALTGEIKTRLRRDKMKIKTKNRPT